MFIYDKVSVCILFIGDPRNLCLLPTNAGWSGGAMVLGKLPAPGQGPVAVGAVGRLASLTFNIYFYLFLFYI